MKKIIYLLFFFGAYSTMEKVYSQTEHKCFFLERKTGESVEKTFVVLVKNGKEVSADIKKELIQNGNNYSRSWEMDGTIDGEKIVFIVPQQTVDMFKKDINPIHGPELIENWILKNDQLIVNENILKSGNCK